MGTVPISARLLQELLGCFGLWQGEGERRATIDLGCGPNLTAMAVDDAMNDRKSYACPGVVADSMQSLKHAEHRVRVAAVEANAVVAHFKNGTVTLLVSANSDGRRPEPCCCT